MSGLRLAGTRLFEKAFSLNDPYLALNALQIAEYMIEHDMVK